MKKLLLLSLLLLLLFLTVKAQLPEPEYHKGKATLAGKIENYATDKEEHIWDEGITYVPAHR